MKPFQTIAAIIKSILSWRRDRRFFDAIDLDRARNKIWNKIN